MSLPSVETDLKPTSTAGVSFEFEGWPVIVERKAFRRSITVSVSLDGPIRVKTSLMTSKSAILSFLEKKKNWLGKHLKNFAKIRQETPTALLRHGEVFPFQGRELQLNCVITLSSKPFFSVHENQLFLHIPRNQWSSDSRRQIYPWIDLLIDFYETEGRKWISHRVKIWSEQMQLFPKQVKFRAPKTRWGSCSSQKILNFNWKLVVFSPATVDYVVIHELAHLKYLNHSKSFWDLVERHCPDYLVSEAELKNKHFRSYFLKT